MGRGLADSAKVLAALEALASPMPFLVGPTLSLADLMLFAFLDFGVSVGQPIDPANMNVLGWYERMKSRPSAQMN